jgi:hypothetical protein
VGYVCCDAFLINVVREDGDDAGEVALSGPTKRGPD